MKLVKFVSVFTVASALAACATSEQPAEKAVKAEPVKSERVVVYNCQNKTKVVAAYDFTDNQATGLTLTVNNKVIKDLERDAEAKDFVTFKSQTHVWNLDEGFDLANYDKKTAVTLYKKGKKADKILAKNCEINQKETAKLNVNN